MIDSHIHLDQYPSNQIDLLIEEWSRAGITGVIAVSTNLESAYKTLKWQDKYPDFIYPTIGYHPEQPFPKQSEIAELFALIKSEKSRIAGIGEVGIPHYTSKNPVDIERYKELLEEFSRLSVHYSLPLALHAVHDKAEIAFDILKKYQVKLAHFHWLKAPLHVIDKIIEANYYISLTPELCYRKRDQELAKYIPLSNLMLETDGPWPYSSIFEGQLTNPTFLFTSINHVARLKNVNDQIVLHTCTQNVLQVYQASAKNQQY